MEKVIYTIRNTYITREWILGRLARAVWIGFDWLRIGTGGEVL
jgi:hypothetical protein